MNETLSNQTQELLREEKIITDTEVAISVGDKYVAENILTKTRRVIHVPQRLIESSTNRRVLKG
tara:strand:+ start:2062 stop:2253 length:192 start_codon:yes stop_codon:yes gene_type:complete